MKMTKFLQYFESSGKFRKTFSAKYIEVHISRKIILFDFHYIFYLRIFCIFLLKLLFLTDTHATLVGNFFIISCLIKPLYSTKCNFLFRKYSQLAIASNSLKKPIKEPILTIEDKKNMKNPQKMTKLPNFQNIWNVKIYFVGKTFSVKYIQYI